MFGSVLRRYLQGAFILTMLALLSLPIARQVPAGAPARPGENRSLAPLPALPRNVAALHVWPEAMDLFLQDHFGLRNQLVDWNDQLLFRVFGQFASAQILTGQNGRIFLASHIAGEANRNSLIYQSCGVQQPEATLDRIASGWAELLARTAGSAPDTRAVIVPSSAALYPEQLPPWLARLCASGRRMTAAVKERLPADLRDRFIDPYPVLAGLGSAKPAIPRRNFHWAGVGPLHTAAWVAEAVLGRAPAAALPGQDAMMPSDLSGFFPGLSLTQPIFEADYAAAHIAPCLGYPCFTELDGDERVLLDVRKYRNANAPGRLLLLTDSYGAFVAGGFAPYFAEVWQLSINDLPLLSPESRARLHAHLITEFAPDVVLLLFHDGSATYMADRLLRQFYLQ